MPRLDDRPDYRLDNGKDAYRRGLFAASLRYHDGTFYVAVTPVGQNSRIYRTRDPRGKWTMNELDRAAFDPGLFIEPDGTGYIATSIGSDGTIRLLKLDRAFARVVDDRKIHYNAGAEGSKIIYAAPVGWCARQYLEPRSEILDFVLSKEARLPCRGERDMDGRFGFTVDEDD